MAKAPITLRSDTWYLRRRVPKRYAQVEPRPNILLSLHTDGKAQAEAIALREKRESPIPCRTAHARDIGDVLMYQVFPELL